jgi:hypothetical protein
MLILGRAMVDTSFASPLRTRWPRPPIVLGQPSHTPTCRPQRAQLELQTLVPTRTARAQPRRQLPIRRPGAPTSRVDPAADLPHAPRVLGDQIGEHLVRHTGQPVQLGRSTPGPPALAISAVSSRRSGSR